MSSCKITDKHFNSENSKVYPDLIGYATISGILVIQSVEQNESGE